MSDTDQIAEIPASNEEKRFERSGKTVKTFTDYFSLAVTTCGVGYLPLAPGTWGSIVGVLIYIGYGSMFFINKNNYISNGGDETVFIAVSFFKTSLLFLLFCLLSFWASAKVEKLLGNKDPQIIVVDEVLGQLLTFAFVPFGISWKLIIAGFILFRLFDIWKPYPIKNAEVLPNGIGVCADDLVAGIYAGICLSFIYLISLAL